MKAAIEMPPRLAKAHEALDRAVDRCYRKDPFPTDRQRVEYLFSLYEQLTAPLTVAKKTKKPRQPKPEAPAPFGWGPGPVILDGGPGEP